MSFTTFLLSGLLLSTFGLVPSVGHQQVSSRMDQIFALAVCSLTQQTDSKAHEQKLVKLQNVKLLRKKRDAIMEKKKGGRVCF